MDRRPLENQRVMKAKLAIDALGALAHECRLSAFRLLVQAGEQGMPAGMIADQLGLPPSTLSFHLAALTHAGMITSRRNGRSVVYAANFTTMDALIGYLTENCCGGVPCLVSAGSGRLCGQDAAA